MYNYCVQKPVNYIRVSYLKQKEQFMIFALIGGRFISSLDWGGRISSQADGLIILSSPM